MLQSSFDRIVDSILCCVKNFCHIETRLNKLDHITYIDKMLIRLFDILAKYHYT